MELNFQNTNLKTQTELKANRIELLLFRFTDLAPDLDEFRRYLSQPELERAARFRFERGKVNFTVGRGMLRHFLGMSLGCDPHDLCFAYGEHGKPYLPDSGIHFNLSHSKERGLLAISPTCELGVDIEEQRMVKNADGISKRFFCPSEITPIHSQDEPTKSEVFLQTWTLKEAWLKAIGTGLQRALNEVDTGFRGSDEQVLCVGDESLQVIKVPDAKAAVCWRHSAQQSCG